MIHSRVNCCIFGPPLLLLEKGKAINYTSVQFTREQMLN